MSLNVGMKLVVGFSDSRREFATHPDSDSENTVEFSPINVFVNDSISQSNGISRSVFAVRVRDSMHMAQ